MRTTMLVGVFMLSAALGDGVAQDRAGYLDSLSKVEAAARARAGAGRTNGADMVIMNADGHTIALGSVIVQSAAIATGNAGDKSPPPNVVTTPPGLAAIVYGDWPDTGSCVDRFQPSRAWQGHRDPRCNDTASHAVVPFGLQLTACEHENGKGGCQGYGPGDHFLHSFNDRATSYFVSDSEMSFYFTSAADEVPAGLQVGVTYSGTTDGGGDFGVSIKIDQDWYVKQYSLELPPWCPKVQVWEATLNDDAKWNHRMEGHKVLLTLAVKPRPTPLAANNWVGVGVRCTH